jgi:hypothetical protein
MFFHLTGIKGAICQSEDLGVLTESLNFVDCPECSKKIREAAIKLHKRRKKDLDRLIIQSVLLDNASKENTPDADWECYLTRARELEEELQEFNPTTPEEGYIMSLLTEEMEKEHARS